MKVLPFESPFYEYLGRSPVGSYLSKYLSELNAKTVVIEEDYVDKNFLIDYAKFYARSFNAPPRFTRRLHFFSAEFGEREFREALTPNRELLKNLQKSYLGFVIVKPIRSREGEPFIGCTNLKTYPIKASHDTRIFLTCTCEASLYGIPLTVESLPFQTQDQAVAACATTALWTSLSPLRGLFSIPLLSPAEITEKAIAYPGLGERHFPSSGLNIFQIAGFINSIGLDTEKIKIPDGENPEDIVSNVVRAYVKAGIPVIAGIKLKRTNSEYDHHAVVISGYRCNSSGEVAELYVHDDQIGPYSRVKCADNSFVEWENEWISRYSYKQVRVDFLLVPIYPKIRLAFGHIHSIHKEYQKYVAQLKDSGISTEFFLTLLNSYKRFLLDHACANKVEVLSKPLPRFLWVIRTLLNGQPVLDSLYDGIEVMPKKLLDISFEIKA